MGNDPLNKTDPTGAIIDTIADLAFVAYDIYALATEPSWTNAGALGADIAGTLIPVATGLGAGVRAAAKGAEKVGDAANATKASKASVPYSRPSGATTKAQRESVQGKPCVKCGAETPKQVAGHKEALVKEHHETGKIDTDKMRNMDAVQPECPTCSAREGAEMSRYSREMNKSLGCKPGNTGC